MSRSLNRLIMAVALAVVAQSPAAYAEALKTLPAECLMMSTAPYSVAEPLVVARAGGKRVRLTVEIADSFAERQQGMMCRTRMGDNEGMLFQFPDVTVRSFWMQQTLIPLDIIYIAPNGRIVSIRKNARPLDRTPLSSGAPAKGVLEVRGGLSDKLGIKPGDRVIHPFFQ